MKALKITQQDDGTYVVETPSGERVTGSTVADALKQLNWPKTHITLTTFPSTREGR